MIRVVLSLLLAIGVVFYGGYYLVTGGNEKKVSLVVKKINGESRDITFKEGDLKIMLKDLDKRGKNAPLYLVGYYEGLYENANTEKKDEFYNGLVIQLAFVKEISRLEGYEVTENVQNTISAYETLVKRYKSAIGQ